MAGRFYTNEPTAKRFAGWKDLRGRRVLEPSAGDGSLVRCITPLAEHVTAIEVVPELVPDLNRVERPKDRYDVLCGDFLTYRPKRRFDVVLMNPPYEDGADVLHVEHALIDCVDPGGIVLVLLRANVPFLKSYAEKILRIAYPVAEARFVARGARFHGPDDKGETPRHDYVALKLEKREDRIEVPFGKGDYYVPKAPRVEYWF